MAKTIIQESDQGIVFRFDKINSGLFNFYIEKTRRFKDKTHQYRIGMEVASDPKKFLILKTIRGHKSDAVKALEQIIKTGII